MPLSRPMDINVNIENVKLEGNGIKVLSSDFDRVGAIGPGQSIQFTFSIQAPRTKRDILPRGLDRYDRWERA